MIVELHNVFNNEGQSIVIDHTLDLTEYDYNGSRPFTSPVKTVGSIKNTAGIVELKANIHFSAEFNCDRCADRFYRDFDFKMEHTLVGKLYDEDNDELLTVPDMKLDIDDLILSDILLAMPTKILCSDSCKGVCAGCGKNLNREECVCKKEIDPRFEALLGLLQDD